MYYALNFVIYSTGVPMAKTAILVGIISMIMIQSVSGASKINYNQDHIDNVTEARIEQKYVSGNLLLKGRATNLADRDPSWAGQSDPYMEVVATSAGGSEQKLKTPHRGGTNNPRWDDYLVFQVSVWKKIAVKIMDYDGSGWGSGLSTDDLLCPTKEIDLGSGGSASFDCKPMPGTVTVEWKFDR